MRTLLLMAILLVGLASAHADEFCDGFDRGYAAGFKRASSIGPRMIHESDEANVNEVTKLATDAMITEFGNIRGWVNQVSGYCSIQRNLHCEAS